MIAIIDSGVANLTSVLAAFERMGKNVVVTDDARLIREADRVILPGVGAAPAAMRKLQEKGLVELIPTLTQPVLGICLGMQLLFEMSEEGEAPTKCLGIMPDRVVALKGGAGLPVPHMGWNALEVKAAENLLLQGIPTGSYVYFVHSFAARVGDLTLASCRYGEAFTAVVGRENFWGCQFHPERSGSVGQRILQNFAEMKA